MPAPGPHRPATARAVTDLQGAVRLAADATVGVTDIVEAMHARIARWPGRPAVLTPGLSAAPGRTGGLSGLVYRSVRGVARAVGNGLDGALGLAAALQGPGTAVAGGTGASPPSAPREALLAALNGVMGDHLADSGNPLAIGMSLRLDGQPLALEPQDLAARCPQPQATVVLLLHGLCMNDLQWHRDGHHHGQALAGPLQASVLSLHYNTGRHIGDNGRELAALLQQLLQAWPVPVRRLVLLGHSMGGLLARSALHQGALAPTGPRPAPATTLVTLGSPHHGAPLERAGQWLTLLLGAVPHAAPLARLGRLRSAGITDLRHGQLLASDTPADGRFGSPADHRTPLPLPPGVACYAVAATVAGPRAPRAAQALGDGLVPLASALGQHRLAAHRLAIATGHQRVFHGMNHLELLASPAVAAQLLDWLAEPGPPAT